MTLPYGISGPIAETPVPGIHPHFSLYICQPL